MFQIGILNRSVISAISALSRAIIISPGLIIPISSAFLLCFGHVTQRLVLEVPTLKHPIYLARDRDQKDHDLVFRLYFSSPRQIGNRTPLAVQDQLQHRVVLRVHKQRQFGCTVPELTRLLEFVRL